MKKTNKKNLSPLTAGPGPPPPPHSARGGGLGAAVRGERFFCLFFSFCCHLKIKCILL